MRHLAYSVITLYFRIITTLVYRDTKYSVPFLTLRTSSTVFYLYYVILRYVLALSLINFLINNIRESVMLSVSLYR